MSTKPAQASTSASSTTSATPSLPVQGKMGKKDVSRLSQNGLSRSAQVSSSVSSTASSAPPRSGKMKEKNIALLSRTEPSEDGLMVTTEADVIRVAKMLSTLIGSELGPDFQKGMKELAEGKFPR